MFNENSSKEDLDHTDVYNESNDVIGNVDSDVYSDNDDKESDIISDCEGAGQIIRSVFTNDSGTMYVFTDTENDGDIDSSDDEREVYIDAVERTYV